MSSEGASDEVLPCAGISVLHPEVAVAAGAREYLFHHVARQSEGECADDSSWCRCVAGCVEVQEDLTERGNVRLDVIVHQEERVQGMFTVEGVYRGCALCVDGVDEVS